MLELEVRLNRKQNRQESAWADDEEEKGSPMYVHTYIHTYLFWLSLGNDDDDDGCVVGSL